MIRVELATEGHIDRILEIEHEAFSPPWTHGALLGEIFRDDSFFAVAVAGEAKPSKHPAHLREGGSTQCRGESTNILGFIILRRATDEAELLQIAVGKDARRRGVADLLMTKANRFAEESEIKSIFLEVRRSNEPAISLYKKHGYKNLRVRKDYYNDPIEDGIVMVRTTIL